jgi:hypothetical protein
VVSLEGFGDDLELILVHQATVKTRSAELISAFFAGAGGVSRKWISNTW